MRTARASAIRPGSTPTPSSAPEASAVRIGLDDHAAASGVGPRRGEAEHEARGTRRTGDRARRRRSSSATPPMRTTRSRSAADATAAASPTSRRHAHRHPQLAGGDGLDGPHGAGAERSGALRHVDRADPGGRDVEQLDAGPDLELGQRRLPGVEGRPDDDLVGAQAAPRRRTSPGTSIVPAGTTPVGCRPTSALASAAGIDRTPASIATRSMRRSPDSTATPGCRSVCRDEHGRAVVAGREQQDPAEGAEHHEQDAGHDPHRVAVPRRGDRSGLEAGGRGGRRARPAPHGPAPRWWRGRGRRWRAFLVLIERGHWCTLTRCDGLSSPLVHQ